MKKLKSAEEEHIKKIGAERFALAIGRAMFQIRRDARLTGLDKSRDTIAFEAALRATGFEERPLKMGFKNITQEFQDICQEAFSLAVEAARCG